MDLRGNLLLHRGPRRAAMRTHPTVLPETCCNCSANHTVLFSAPIQREIERQRYRSEECFFLLCCVERTGHHSIYATGTQCILESRTGHLGRHLQLFSSSHFPTRGFPSLFSCVQFARIQNILLRSSISHFSSLRCRTLVKDGKCLQAGARTAAVSACNGSGLVPLQKFLRPSR